MTAPRDRVVVVATAFDRGPLSRAVAGERTPGFS